MSRPMPVHTTSFCSAAYVRSCAGTSTRPCSSRSMSCALATNLRMFFCTRRSKGLAWRTRSSSFFHSESGRARRAFIPAAWMRNTFGSPAAASSSRNLAGRLVRPFASMVWWKVPENTVWSFVPLGSASWHSFPLTPWIYGLLRGVSTSPRNVATLDLLTRSGSRAAHGGRNDRTRNGWWIARFANRYALVGIAGCRRVVAWAPARVPATCRLIGPAGASCVYGWRGRAARTILARPATKLRRRHGRAPRQDRLHHRRQPRDRQGHRRPGGPGRRQRRDRGEDEGSQPEAAGHHPQRGGGGRGSGRQGVAGAVRHPRRGRREGGRGAGRGALRREDR